MRRSQSTDYEDMLVKNFEAFRILMTSFETIFLGEVPYVQNFATVARNE